MNERAPKIDCIYLDKDTWCCGCAARQRHKTLAKLFGPKPACILVGAPANLACSDREAASRSTGVSHTVWDRLGEDDVDPSNLDL